MPIPPYDLTLPRHDKAIDWLHALSLDLKLTKIAPQEIQRPINKLRLAEWGSQYATELAHCWGQPSHISIERESKAHVNTLEFVHKLIEHVEQGVDENDPLKYITEWELGEILIQANELEACRQQTVFY